MRVDVQHEMYSEAPIKPAGLAWLKIAFVALLLVSGYTVLRSIKAKQRDLLSAELPANPWRFGVLNPKLQQAILADDGVIVSELLKSEPRENVRSVILGSLSRLGKPHALKAFINAGWPVEGPFGDGTPLCEAIRSGYPDVARILIESGADENKGFRNFYKKYGLDTVLLNPKMLQLLIDKKVDLRGVWLMEESVSENRLQSVKVLVNAHFPISEQVRLANCVSMPQGVEIAKLLLDRGLPPDIVSNEPWQITHWPTTSEGKRASSYTYVQATPLYFAAREGDLSMVQLLLDHGANPALKDQQGRSVFDVATPEAKALLLKTKARPTGVSRQTLTPR